MGEEKTRNRLKERFYWPGHWTDVQNWCRTCSTCATRKTAAPKKKAPLNPVQVGYPMQMIAVDIMGPLPETPSGNSYILVAGDYFTRWMEAYAIPNQEAITVAQKLVDELFCRFSPPEQLHSDQGRQFESTQSLTHTKELHITHKVMDWLSDSIGHYRTCSQPRARTTPLSGMPTSGRCVWHTTAASNLQLATRHSI